MTKREFDHETKENWGEQGMARDERCDYRERRMLEHNGSGAHGSTRTRMSLIDRRADHARRRNIGGFIPALDRGSMWRSIADHRARLRIPLLG